MPCYHPIPGWYAKRRSETTGKRAIVFRMADGFVDRPIDIPCGSCVGCQLEKARRWAVRCTHEASLHAENSFVTLTYSPEKVPPNASLRPEDFVRFMKRLRHKRPGVRFFQCGEYGAKLGRPHHHALLFGCGWPDQVELKQGLFVSQELSELWPYGYSSIGQVTFESAGYVARYAMKKVRGPDAAAHYGQKVPEYLTMSRRPGIGRGWIDKYESDVYPSDEVVMNGARMRPPRYYDDTVARRRPDLVERCKSARREAHERNPPSGGDLVVMEVVKHASLRTLSRDLEES